MHVCTLRLSPRLGACTPRKGAAAHRTAAASPAPRPVERLSPPGCAHAAQDGRNRFGTTPLQMAQPACAPALRDVAAAGAPARARLAEALAAEAAAAAAATQAAAAAAVARCGTTQTPV